MIFNSLCICYIKHTHVFIIIKWVAELIIPFASITVKLMQ